MKNRKTVVVAFLLAAVVLLGVGYAELTDLLTVNGELAALTSTTQTEFDADVYFSATSVVTDQTGNNAASQIKEGRDDATITAKHFTIDGQVVKVKYTIVNDSTDFDAVVTPNAAVETGSVTVDNGAAHPDPVFTVSWSWAEDSSVTGEATITKGASKDFWVTITLVEPPMEEHNATFEVSFDVEAVKP